MKLKIVVLLLFMIVISTSFSIFVSNVNASNTDIYVKADYSGYSDGTAEKPYDNIEEALKNANNGDTIYIFGGLYQEDLTINKKVYIEGGIGGETIIDTRFDRRYLVEITADEVTIKGITFSDDDSSMTSPIGALVAISSNNNRIVGNKFQKNTYGYGIHIASSANDNFIINNYINNSKQGIHIASSSTNDLAKNEIYNCSEYGINMDASGGNNRLYSNIVENCPYGIRVKNSENINLTHNEVAGSINFAIYISWSPDAVITNNLIEDNTGDGFYLSSSNCYLKNNTIKNNKRGITLIGSNNIIKNNTITKSSASGIHIESGNGNILHLNKFTDNHPSAQDKGTNNWYYNSQGNYWGDYYSIDKDQDGIGDVFYSKNGVNDKYPLGYFLQPPKKPSNPSPEDGETDVSLDVTLNVHIEDPDTDNKLTVTFYGGIREADGTLNIKKIDSQSQNPVTNVINNTNVECSFTIAFNTTYAWYAIADDGLLQNKSDTFFFYTAKTPPDNKPPVADAGGPYIAEPNETVSFDSSESYDPDGKIDFYRWNFGDGTSEILQENPDHNFSRDGLFYVTLTVVDNNGTSSTDVTTIEVGDVPNLPPTAGISLPSLGNTNEQISFTSTSSDPDGDDLSYLWNIDGKNFSGSSTNYQFNSPGNYVVTLTVSDGEFEDTVTDSITIEKKEEETPGFELIIALVSLLLLIILSKKKYQ